jgi:flagellar basal body-associated protein FliL
MGVDFMKLESLFIFLVVLLVIAGAVYIIVGFWPTTSAVQQPAQSSSNSQNELAIAQMNYQIQLLNSQIKAQQAAEQQQMQQQMYQRTYYTERYLDNSDIYGSDRTYRYDLTVRVDDDETNDAIEDARVSIENGESDSDYTDNDGEAFFSNLKDECYDVYVSKSGYYSESRQVCISTDRTISFALEPK